MKHEMDRLLKKTFEASSVHPSDELNRKTIELMKAECDNGKVKPFKHLKAAAIIIAACCVIGIIAGPSVYTFAEQKMREWRSSVEFDDGSSKELGSELPCRKLPESAVMSNDNAVMTTVSKAEKALGFDLLGHEAAADDEVFYCMEVNEDGSLACIYMWISDWMKLEGNSNINLTISVLNEGADEKWVETFESGWNASEKEFVEEYVSDSLGSKVIVYKPGRQEEFQGYIMATFVYNNVLYELNGWQITAEELKNIIEEMN